MDRNKNIPQLDAAGLRKFGFLMAATMPVLFGLLLPWLLGKSLPLWPWAAGLFLAAWSLAYPIGLNFLYHLWMRFGLIMGWFSSRLVLGIIFYFIFTPISWFWRLRGTDPLNRRLEPEADTYRKQSARRNINHMEKPF